LTSFWVLCVTKGEKKKSYTLGGARTVSYVRSRVAILLERDGGNSPENTFYTGGGGDSGTQTKRHALQWLARKKAARVVAKSQGPFRKEKDRKTALRGVGRGEHAGRLPNPDPQSRMKASLERRVTCQHGEKSRKWVGFTTTTTKKQLYDVPAKKTIGCKVNDTKILLA